MGVGSRGIKIPGCMACGHEVPMKGILSAYADWAKTVREVVPIGAAV